MIKNKAKYMHYGTVSEQLICHNRKCRYMEVMAFLYASIGKILIDSIKLILILIKIELFRPEIHLCLALLDKMYYFPRYIGHCFFNYYGNAVMKKFYILFFLLVTISGLNAQQIALDTLSSRYVGPGVLYTDILAPSVPWTIKVLRVDLKNKYLSLEAVKSKDTYFGYEKTSAMSKRNNYTGHTVVGAVNADYYNTSNGSLTNIQVGKGEIYRGPVRASVIGFDINKKPMIEICTLKANLIVNSKSIKIDEVNQTRSTGQLILYNYYKGTSTGTDTAGNEALVRPVSGWLANDTVVCVVENVTLKTGNMNVPKGKAVLSGNGTAAAFIADNLHAGDTVKLFMGLTPALSKIKEMVGGHPRLVKEGINYLETALKYEPGSSTTTRAPRTVAGFSKDSTYLYLITLDGRQASSDGATLAELADLIIRLGVYDGFNLDGGGSTTMVLRNAVMNSPSDGNERSVANCLMVVSSAPARPDSLGRIGFLYNFSDYKIYNVDKLQLAIYVNDIYDNPVTPDASQIKYSVSPGLGTVDANGLFAPSKTAKSGYIYVSYKGLKDSVYISIIQIARIALTPRSSMIDASKPYELTVKGYTASNVERIMKGGDLLWRSSDTTVAAVDADGVIRGKAEGKVKIYAKFSEGIADSVDITVQIGKGTMLTDQFDSIGSWTLSGSSIDFAATKLSVSTDIRSEGSGSFQIDYKYTYDPTKSNLVQLNNTIPLYGLPDSLQIDVRSDSSVHKIFLIVANDQNKPFRVNTNIPVPQGAKFTTIPIAFKDNVPVTIGTFSYPIKLAKIVIQLEADVPGRVQGQTYSGRIYLDNVRVRYPMDATGVTDGGSQTPQEYSLQQNYPNPFNPSTIIEFSTTARENTTLSVFDLLGRQVAVLVNSELSAGRHRAVWNAAGCPSGVYFYRLQSGNYAETKKMLLIR